MVRTGALEKRTVDAVLEAAGAVALNVRQGHPAGLSDREVEVLRLIAQGRTSRQIAEALVITEKTAGHHVEHIYAKARRLNPRWGRAVRDAARPGRLTAPSRRMGSSPDGVGGSQA